MSTLENLRLMKNQSDHEAELVRFSGAAELRRQQRKQLVVVSVVLVGVAITVLGMAWHLLNRP
jgi:hypothetical protein